jgi:hypothetical protein
MNAEHQHIINLIGQTSWMLPPVRLSALPRARKLDAGGHH